MPHPEPCLCALTSVFLQEIGSIAWALPRLVCQAQRPCVTQLHHRAEAWPTADSAQPRSLACTWLASVESELGARWVGLPDRDNPPPGYSWGSGAGGGERASPGSSSSRHEPTAQTTVSVVRAMALLQHTPSAPFLGAMWAHVQVGGAHADSSLFPMLQCTSCLCYILLDQV